MAHRKVEHEIEALNRLREAPPGEAAAALRKALADRVNLMCAKAARLTAELRLAELIPDLLRSFDRLSERAAERDPQCWGKNAIARALVDLEYRESAPFARGARHVQMEAAWGGAVDSAPALRGICLLALPACSDLARVQAMRFLVDGLCDPAQTVRVEAVRGLELMEGEAALLLRLKARLGDQEGAVTGQVFDSILRLERDSAIPFLSGFLNSEDEARGEAALALGSSRLPAAVEVLREAWVQAHDFEFRQTLLRALSISRQEAAIEFLVDLLRNGRPVDRESAEKALRLHESPEIRRLLDEALEFHRKERMEE
jgi:hypothetical protein